MLDSEGPIILYTSNYCGQARGVENFLKDNGLPVEVLNIDRDLAARRRLIELNGGFASVPTLVFPDGRRLTEPSLSMLRQELSIEESGLGERVRRILSDGS
jgi:mycoredoxin